MDHRALYAYPWDLLQGTPPRLEASAVADLLGGLGLRDLTLAASYHAGKFLRPRGLEPGAQPGAVVFPADGRVYFRPRLERYGLLKPEAHPMVTEADPFEVLAGQAAFRLHAWTVLLHNTRLGELHPEVTARNAFGDAYPYSLCPSAPEVRAYAVALCADLGDRAGLAGLALETPGWLGYVHGFHHEFDQVGPNPWLSAYLGLCFCPACRAGAASAGLPVEAIQARVAARIRTFLLGPAFPTRDQMQAWLWADGVEDPELAAFLRWRCGVVTSLVAEIRAALPPAVAVHVIATCQAPHALALLEGHDLRALARACDGLELPLYQPTPEAVAADLWDVLRRAEPPVPPRVILRPHDLPGPALAQAVEAVRGQGVRDLAFYNVGLLRPVQRAWIPQALASH